MSDKSTDNTEAKRFKYIYEKVSELDRQLQGDNYKTVERYKVADIYDKDKLLGILNTAVTDPKTSKKWRFTPSHIEAFNNDPTELLAFFDKFINTGELVIEKYNIVTNDPKYSEYFATEPTVKYVAKPPAGRLLERVLLAGKGVDDNDPNERIKLTEYAILDIDKLLKAIEQEKRSDFILYKLEIPQDIEQVQQTVDRAVKANNPDLLKDLPSPDRYAEKLVEAYGLTPYAGKAVWTHFDTYLLQGELGGLVALTRVTDDIQGNAEIATAPTQTELFSNMVIGLDTADITGRHQFFSPMFRGFMSLGEQGLFTAVERANRGSKTVTIPYETKGSNSVYRTKMQTEIELSGHSRQVIRTAPEAERFMARLIKAQGILYLWAMYTNSLTIYSTKVSDMLRLAGFKGRIKPEHYIDITEGIAGLFAIAVTKTDDHYTDPKTGKKVYVGKNEMYGEVVRPIGEVQAVWHMQDKPYYYTEAEFNNLDEITRNNLDYKGEVKQEYTEVDKNGKRQNKTRQVNKYYQILTTNKSNKDKTTEAIEYEKQPAYIKQLIRLEIAKGMLNPTARRATLVSKALLRLNTLQERQYLQLGSFISDHFSQYQDRTVEGKPIRLTLQTLLEWRGLADPDNLQRVSRTKQHLQQALDKLIEIGHIAKWEIEGARYDKLGLSPDDRSRIVLIYPAQAIVEALRPVIAEPDEKLKKVLKEQVREQGATKVAEQYETTADAINGIINNRETVDSLPKKAYDDLKLKAYDKQNNK
jgi:hypothetical protein